MSEFNSGLTNSYAHQQRICRTLGPRADPEGRDRGPAQAPPPGAASAER